MKIKPFDLSFMRAWKDIIIPSIYESTGSRYFLHQTSVPFERQPHLEISIFNLDLRHPCILYITRSLTHNRIVALFFFVLSFAEAATNTVQNTQHHCDVVALAFIIPRPCANGFRCCVNSVNGSPKSEAKLIFQIQGGNMAAFGVSYW